MEPRIGGCGGNMNMKALRKLARTDMVARKVRNTESHTEDDSNVKYTSHCSRNNLCFENTIAGLSCDRNHQVSSFSSPRRVSEDEASKS